MANQTAAIRSRGTRRPMPMNSSVRTTTFAPTAWNPGSLSRSMSPSGTPGVDQSVLIALDPQAGHRAAPPVRIDQLAEPAGEVDEGDAEPEHGQRQARAAHRAERGATTTGPQRRRARRCDPTATRPDRPAGSAGTPGCDGSASATGRGCRRRRPPSATRRPGSRGRSTAAPRWRPWPTTGPRRPHGEAPDTTTSTGA